jgi:hypothetical protein
LLGEGSSRRRPHALAGEDANPVYGRLFKGPKAPLKNWQKAMEPLANESK